MSEQEKRGGDVRSHDEFHVGAVLGCLSGGAVYAARCCRAVKPQAKCCDVRRASHSACLATPRERCGLPHRGEAPGLQVMEPGLRSILSMSATCASSAAICVRAYSSSMMLRPLT